MATLHFTVAEAAAHLPDVLARLRAGEQVVIEDGDAPITLELVEPLPEPYEGTIPTHAGKTDTALRAMKFTSDSAKDLEAAWQRFRNAGIPTPQEDPSTVASMARARFLEQERGSRLVVDEGFADDMEEVLARRGPSRGDPWA